MCVTQSGSLRAKHGTARRHLHPQEVVGLRRPGRLRPEGGAGQEPAGCGEGGPAATPPLHVGRPRPPRQDRGGRGGGLRGEQRQRKGQRSPLVAALPPEAAVAAAEVALLRHGQWRLCCPRPKVGTLGVESKSGT